MRNKRFDRLLAGTVLGAAMLTPTLSMAQQDRVEPARPLPPSLNGQMLRHRDPAPPPQFQIPAMQQREATPARALATPTPREADNIDLKGSLDNVMAASDTAVIDRLRALVTAKQLDKRIDNATDRKAIETFYAARNYAPVWIRDGQVTPQAKSAIARLKNAAADGLDASDYPTRDFAGNADALADADLRLSQSLLVYTRHLAVGRVAPTRVTVEVDYGNHTPDADDVLKKLASARDIDTTIESYNPPHAGFRALKARLADLRANSARASADESRIPEGAAVKPGAKDERIPLLRERLKTSAPGDSRVVVRERGRQVVKHVKADELVYDKALYNAIRNVQANADIKPTGIIDNKTIAAINGPKPGQVVDRVLANMERWRWLPRDLGRAYVMVNIPDYTLKVVRDGSQVWTTKIVAGKPQTPTPLLTAAMDNVIVNPSWYVPQSIIQNELLPLYASDPNIFDRMGLEVKKGPDGHINVVQPPGAANALGRIKFNFPNRYQVYLHDTPEKRLFSADKRAFSHGCMRVENPTKFGEIMLAMAIPGQTPTQPQLERLIGHDEKTFKMVNKPMVHLTYQTAYVDDGGKLVLRDDIYGFDARIRAILHSDERRIADVAPPQDPKRELATMKSNQEILRRVERREAQNPMAFFERLFR
ncbi:murein L,D-transpeptidase [Pseudolabrys taiwanensis]|uniref:Murein L,D-transpeptidase n=1 Tax=Pseudolabrys taiwanensis TaxID=331696 RepID=A0A346A1Y0_9HYPH|nr:L,D-transpeptidase family protein [Pseudolabrys taiwanensis]AXK83177.1 murein L,D-transpeptidase [Pseudolabrys taiwanensis]